MRCDAICERAASKSSATMFPNEVQEKDQAGKRRSVDEQMESGIREADSKRQSSGQVGTM